MPLEAEDRGRIADIKGQAPHPDVRLVAEAPDGVEDASSTALRCGAREAASPHPKAGRGRPGARKPPPTASPTTTPHPDPDLGRGMG